MEQNQPGPLTSGLSGSGPREAIPGAADGVSGADPAAEKIAFGSVANPKRLRLGVPRSA
ncbi:conserved hypothetical protein [Frankia canadensis]|uniref:Uncharacterized protein n=1 Tax=Frankia canadensis TaxID=1836972 RepID=A0A2I2KK06_9ACTN|nr:hypothetical protein [Frankia canadensis]SNQ45993.1 conserved hypothetical protein [Frankia canadensis]SOU53283.1 conserved hypothetical protein [Frankia canadensis]